MPHTAQRNRSHPLLQNQVTRQLLWLVALPTALGCEALGVDPPGGAACTLIGCQDGLRLTLQRTSPWPAGDYVLQVTLDNQPVVTCTASLPFASATAAATCSSADVQLQTSGQALDPSQHALTGVWVRTTPTKVRLVLQQGPTTLLDQTLQPTYQATRPNGPDCEPECTQASATLVVE